MSICCQRNMCCEGNGASNPMPRLFLFMMSRCQMKAQICSVYFYFQNLVHQNEHSVRLKQLKCNEMHAIIRFIVKSAHYMKNINLSKNSLFLFLLLCSFFNAEKVRNISKNIWLCSESKYFLSL